MFVGFKNLFDPEGPVHEVLRKECLCITEIKVGEAPFNFLVKYSVKIKYNVEFNKKQCVQLNRRTMLNSDGVQFKSKMDYNVMFKLNYNLKLNMKNDVMLRWENDFSL